MGKFAQSPRCANGHLLVEFASANQIDPVLVRPHWTSSVIDCQVYSGTQTGTEHGSDRLRNDISRDQRQVCRRENAERTRLILLLISSVPWLFATNIDPRYLNLSVLGYYCPEKLPSNSRHKLPCHYCPFFPSTASSRTCTSL